MAFHNPEAFWLLLTIPILAVLGALLSLQSRRDRKRFAEPQLFSALTGSLSRPRRNLGTACFFLGMLFLTFAIAEPRFGTKTEVVKRTGIDIIIALDTSLSMLAEDIRPNRLAQAKYEIGRLIDNLEGDRVALVVFSGRALVQCPLTNDYAAAKNLLDFVEAGIVPVAGTNIEDAVAASLDLLERGSEVGSESQLIILFTDGESLSGNPEGAAKKASGQGVHIIAVGIGTVGGELIPLRDEKGSLSGYKQDNKGEIVKTSLDEEVLRKVALLSGGAFLWEPNGEVSMDAVLQEVGGMKRADLSERRISRLKERYQIPLGVSLLFFLTWLVIGERRGGRLKAAGGKKQ
ncbi:MAG: vWA domain-containing protein [Candidatus Latescibacterota bacterium]